VARRGKFLPPSPCNPAQCLGFWDFAADVLADSRHIVVNPPDMGKLSLALKNAAAEIFVRAEARGAFRKLPAFESDFLHEYPALAVLQDNYATVREECLTLLGRRDGIPNINELSSQTASGIHAIAWKTFMFKSGKFIDENCALAPKTAALLRGIPGIYTAFFSILEPRQHIKPHWGYWKGFVRYHLGVVIPGNNEHKQCWIRINPQANDRARREEIEQGKKYYWTDGEAVLFDDCFLHEAANESDDVRAVLFLDVARKMPWHLSLMNRFFLWVAHMDESVRKIRANAKVTNEPVNEAG
jgi:ornithine lipid ester-linked acyl 2-hydroxylase